MILGLLLGLGVLAVCSCVYRWLGFGRPERFVLDHWRDVLKVKP